MNGLHVRRIAVAGLTVLDCFSGSAPLTGTVTLNAQGNPNAVFIFKIGSTLVTASGSRATLINDGEPCNVFWQVGSSATLGTSTTLAGNILALASITLTTGASMVGRTLARTGAVTLDTNSVSVQICTVPVPTLPGPFVLPLALALLGIGCLALQRRRQPAGVRPAVRPRAISVRLPCAVARSRGPAAAPRAGGGRRAEAWAPR